MMMIKFLSTLLLAQTVVAAHDLRDLQASQCVVNLDAAQSTTKEVMIVTERNGVDGYFKIRTLKNQAPWTTQNDDFVVPGWCLDFERFISFAQYSMDVYTLMDDELPSGLQNGVVNTAFRAVDKPENRHILNYLINQKMVGKVWQPKEVAGFGYCNPTAPYKIRWQEVQLAVWRIIDDVDVTKQTYVTGEQCVAKGIADDAFAKGKDYKVNCTNPGEVIPLAYTFDDVDGGAIKHQVIISEYPVSEIEGMCTCSAPTKPPTPAPTPCVAVAPYPDTRLGVPSKGYEGNPNCKDLGYSWGYKMEGCFATSSSTFFDKLVKTEGECSSGTSGPALGSFTLKCESGGIDAVITSTTDAAVIMKGGPGGTIYNGLKAGTTYKLDIGPTRKQISHIEFCFMCQGCAAPTVPTKPPTPGPTMPPTPGPTKPPTPGPTMPPTPGPTKPPTPGPTLPPTPGPTMPPTPGPTKPPTPGPTMPPTPGPTQPPTPGPTVSPTKRPTLGPTAAPTPGPTTAPVVPPTAPPAPDQPPVGDRTGPPTYVKGDPHFKTFGGEMYDVSI
jgi:hypothetical protein